MKHFPSFTHFQPLLSSSLPPIHISLSLPAAITFYSSFFSRESSVRTQRKVPTATGHKMGTEELSFFRFSKGPFGFFPASQRRFRCSNFFSSEKKLLFLRTALKKLRLFILFSLWLSIPHLNFLSPSLLLLRAPLRLIQKLFFHQGNCWFCFDHERRYCLPFYIFFISPFRGPQC